MWPSFCDNGHPHYNHEDSGKFLFMHTYAYQAILLASGFGLVFRLNQSLARYWEARSALQNMAAKWCCGVMMTAHMDEEAHDEKQLEEKQSAAFARTLLHLTSLLHATAMHTLRGDMTFASLQPCKSLYGNQQQPSLRAGWFDSQKAFCLRNPIAVLGGLLPLEARKMQASSERVHVVLGWIHRLLVQRRKQGGLAHDAPIVSRIYQVFSDGTLWYHAALKVVDTPFPFAYAQLNSFICLVNLALFPVVVVDKVASLPLAVAIAFCSIAFLFGLNELARDLEDPFTTQLGFSLGVNRIHVPTLQRFFDERLLSIDTLAGAVEIWPAGRVRYGPFLARTLRADQDGMEAEMARAAEHEAKPIAGMSVMVESDLDTRPASPNCSAV